MSRVGRLPIAIPAGVTVTVTSAGIAIGNLPTLDIIAPPVIIKNCL